MPKANAWTKWKYLSAIAVLSMLLGACGEEQAATQDEPADDEAEDVEEVSGFPEGPIELVVPFGTGGRTDLTARILADFLEEELSESVVVVNRPGAGGIVASDSVRTAAPDGHTLLIHSTAFVVAAATNPEAPSVSEFTLISLINEDPAAVAVNAEVGFDSVSALVEFAQSNPGELDMGTTPGTSTHVYAVGFADAAGIDVNFVPYEGGGDRAPALAGGHIDVNVDIVATQRSLADAGLIDIIGIAADERNELYPDIPTLSEQGVDLTISSWHGVLAPPDLPPAVAERLEAALESITSSAGYVEAMEDADLGVRYMDSEDFATFATEQMELVDRMEEKLGL